MARVQKHSGGHSSHNALEHLSHGYKCQSCNSVDDTCALCHQWSGVNKDSYEERTHYEIFKILHK